MKKINVIGTTGTGKSTFATALSEKLNYPCIHMDQLFWKPDWEASSDDEFTAKIAAALATDCWVLDGNYNRTNQVKWQHADTVIWLDYSFFRTFWQLFTRTMKRSANGIELWPGTGNRESLWKAFCTKDSILLWFFLTWGKNRKRYPLIAQSPEFKHITFVRLTSPAAAKAFLHDS